MTGIGDVTDRIVAHRRLVIAVLLLVSAVVGVGAAQVEESSSLSQFETDSTEAQKLDYVESNFTADENTTTVQVIVRGDDVLSRASLLDHLRFQRTLTENDTVNETLSDAQRPVGVANIAATAAVRQERAANLSTRARELQAARTRLNRTGERLGDALNRTRSLQQRYDALNRSVERDEIDDQTYRQRAGAIERNLSTVRERAAANLSSEQAAEFDDLFDRARTLQSELDRLNASYRAGDVDRSTYRERAEGIQSELAAVYDDIPEVLAPEANALEERAAALRADRAAFQAEAESGTTPPLDEQLTTLESMNATAVERAVGEVLDPESNAGAFALMPTDYESGSATADATMIVVTQTTRSDTVQGSASDRITDAQLAVQDIAGAELGGESMVFGAGIIADETNRSMQDSLVVVGPLAIAFVLAVLTFAYRDLVDILLGLIGIGLVLLVTFGFMGWAGISFNQLFVAIPVLLIGLSIDYAIHVFMRHREERTARETADPASSERDESDGEGDDSSVAGSMRTALAGVMTALVLVTATTVIGFLSNLTSPVGPIREFGLVSAVGIVAALLVFGALMPAIKVEVDGLLERFGLDRRKTAFGTGGGAFSRVLGLGATAARRAPWAVILLTLLVSAAGAYGALGVDTSFQQKDFIAEEPPEWMDELPESMQPGEYTMRATFEYVNDNFLREDSTAEFLFEREVTTATALEKVDRARSEVAQKNVTVVLSNGEPDIRSPLTVMRSVAATNESFNATLTAADADGDGVPDRNVAGVYDTLFDAAPDQARAVIHREGGEYRALRLTASLEGGASGQAITDQMNAVERSVQGDGVRVTATGSPIVNKIVQDDLLQTVVESLVVTLVASFLFLMVVYRLTEGSATLGLVTLLPVAFNVAWILGTMYVLDIPFNVLTGMITSLTIGLGVAYSIHVSERYSLELGRQRSAWDAMHTAVTGTGGALLGSAATTVGGFGVLVFAILPPLQQFGFITGLTIVYAFLASVFVLPSLLVVWTRFFGPSGAFGADQPPEGFDDDSPDETGADLPADGAGAGSAGAADGDGTAAPATRAGRSDGQTTAPTRSDGEATPFATRVVEPRHARPGGDVSVAVTVSEATGRVALVERTPGAGARIASVSPPPAERVAADGRVYVVWDLDEAARPRVEYALALPDDLADGETAAFDGELLLPDHAVDVVGDGGVDVSTDAVGAMLANGGASRRDVADASRLLASGSITAAEFERVMHAWLDERATASATEGSDD